MKYVLSVFLFLSLCLEAIRCSYAVHISNHFPIPFSTFANVHYRLFPFAEVDTLGCLPIFQALNFVSLVDQTPCC